MTNAHVCVFKKKKNSDDITQLIFTIQTVLLSMRPDFNELDLIILRISFLLSHSLLLI